MMAVLVGLLAGTAVLLLVPARPALTTPTARPGAAPRPGWMRRARPVLAVLSGCAAAVFIGGTPGLVAGPVAVAVAWWAIARAEPPGVRRARQEVRRDLPHLVLLLATALRSGMSAGDGVRMACAALPGGAAARLATVTERLALGVEPAQVWATLETDPELAPLGRALARAHRTGAPVVAAVERLGDDLERGARARVEERARQVGVRAALPLGLCLLPSFLLLGIVPLVAGLVSSMSL
jgi:Flp pilus assembly protein TadB